jgi:hypothetical protein
MKARVHIRWSLREQDTYNRNGLGRGGSTRCGGSKEEEREEREEESRDTSEHGEQLLIEGE